METQRSVPDIKELEAVRRGRSRLPPLEPGAAAVLSLAAAPDGRRGWTG